MTEHARDKYSSISEKKTACCTKHFKDNKGRLDNFP